MSKGIVSLFVCGAQKCGTTSLRSYLREHCELGGPDCEEVHFFDDESQNWISPNYDELEAHYRYDAGVKFYFDVTPIYMFWPDSIARIQKYNPCARLVFLFRDPFERAVSQWRMEYARGDENLPFSDAIRSGRSRLLELPRTADYWRIFSYLERGLYAEQVRRALTYFPRSQLLFLDSNEFKSDYAKTLDRISQFLGISPFRYSGQKRERSQPDVMYPAEPTNTDALLVSDFIGGDLEEFSSLTHIDISNWPTYTCRSRNRFSLVSAK